MEFERELIRERTIAGLSATRARGRKSGRKLALTKAKVRLAQAVMSNRDTSVAELCRELRIKRVTLYRYVGPDGDSPSPGIDPNCVIDLPCVTGDPRETRGSLDFRRWYTANGREGES